MGLTFCGFIACFNVAGDQYPPPLLKKKTEHDRTLILTRLQRVPKKKKKKRNQEWENGAFWPYCGFILDSARGMGEGGGGVDVCCFKSVDQTRYTTVLRPSESNDGPTISVMSVFVF